MQLSHRNIHGERGAHQAAALIICQFKATRQRVGQAGAQQGMQNAVAAEMGHGAVKEQKLGSVAVFFCLALDVFVQHVQLFLTIRSGADAGQQSSQFGFHGTPAFHQIAGQCFFAPRALVNIQIFGKVLDRPTRVVELGQARHHGADAFLGFINFGKDSYATFDALQLDFGLDAVPLGQQNHSSFITQGAVQ